MAQLGGRDQKIILLVFSGLLRGQFDSFIDCPSSSFGHFNIIYESQIIVDCLSINWIGTKFLSSLGRGRKLRGQVLCILPPELVPGWELVALLFLPLFFQIFYILHFTEKFVSLKIAEGVNVNDGFSVYFSFKVKCVMQHCFQACVESCQQINLLPFLLKNLIIFHSYLK